MINYVYRDEDQSNFELDDEDIAKILIITPTPPSHRKSREKPEKKAAESTPRARMTPEVARLIDAGLKCYESSLWKERTPNVCEPFFFLLVFFID